MPGLFRNAAERPAAPLTGLQARLALALGGQAGERHSLDLHAVLNLLNRFVGTRDDSLREDMVSRLGEYLAAAHRVEAGPHVTLGGLCELARSYAAMRYLMADAIEPRFTRDDIDIRLRTEQAADMIAFLQTAVDTLLTGYTPWVHLAVQPLRWWTVEITLSVGSGPAGDTAWCSGWKPLERGGHTRSARFTATAQALPRAAGGRAA